MKAISTDYLGKEVYVKIDILTEFQEQYFESAIIRNDPKIKL